MEDVRISVDEAQVLYGKSRSTIYAWMERNKLRYENIGQNRIIIISKDEYDKLRANGFQDSEQESDIIPGNIQNRTQESRTRKQENPEYINIFETFLNKFDNLYSEIRILERESGQIKLLEDSENRTRLEYLKLVQENAVLKSQNEQHQERIKILEEENEKLKKQSWKFWQK